MAYIATVTEIVMARAVQTWVKPGLQLTRQYMFRASETTATAVERGRTITYWPMQMRISQTNACAACAESQPSSGSDEAARWLYLAFPLSSTCTPPLQPPKRPDPFLDVNVLHDFSEPSRSLNTSGVRCRARLVGGRNRRAEISEEEGEEGAQNDRLVAVSSELEVECRMNEVVAQEAADRVEWYQE